MIRRRGTIDNTNSILDAWIMVEHLSEGEINLKDRDILLLDDLTDKKYKKYFQTLMERSEKKKYKNSGLVLYLDIFKFAEVVEFLREKYGVAKTQSDINYGNKFSIALYFDKNINFISDNIFFTCSGYMRYLQDVPSKSDFQEFEEKFKEKTIKRFEGSEDNQEKFDNALNALLNEYNIDIKNCRVQILSNIETEATNLHSFFIEDLNKAKEIDNTNLKRYLTGGNIKDRINLDSKNDSPNYNQSVFEKILEPQNYPLGRFPSKTEFALSFMQQVAVNLTIGYDNSNMRSVNGPPGTG
ncbi:MAG: DNA helicase, partial [Lachnospiraceae bacterium oral taxon 082]|nr:DNA helicase [Lachnospiraceae bacterium oral taxon 082]